MTDKRKSGASVPRATKSKYQPKSNSSSLTYILGGLAILVIAALVVGGVILNNRDKGEGGGGADDPALAAAATHISGPEGKPTIDLFEDPLCPACRNLEEVSGEAITKAIKDGKLRVRFHTLNFLNRASASGDYSTRAGGALRCVAENDTDEEFLKFHTALFKNQPQENGTSDHSNADLAKLAGTTGAKQQTQDCIAQGKQVQAAGAAAETSAGLLSKALGGNASTPSILHDGKPITNGVGANNDWLNELIR